MTNLNKNLNSDNDSQYISTLLSEKKSYQGPCIVAIGTFAFIGLIGAILGLIWGVLRYFNNKNIDDRINNMLLLNKNIDRKEIAQLQFNKNNQLHKETVHGIIIGTIIFIIIFVIVIIVVVIVVLVVGTRVNNEAQNNMIALINYL